MQCLIYHRSFDGAIAIYDSKWYIKRLNNIEIDKKKGLFWVVKTQFSVSLKNNVEKTNSQRGMHLNDHRESTLLMTTGKVHLFKGECLLMTTGKVHLFKGECLLMTI